MKKNILIIGATGSIGSRAAKLLADSGENLFLAGKNIEKLQEVASACGVHSDRYCTVDITQASAIRELRDRFFKQLSSIDILINAASIGIIKPMDTLDESDFLHTLHTNLYAPFLLMKTFLPVMKERKKGLIINIPGELGKVPMAGGAAYCASKFGLVGMMQSIREELHATDIKITNLFLGGVEQASWESLELKVQQEKLLQTEEAVKAIWFLCQQANLGMPAEVITHTLDVPSP